MTETEEQLLRELGNDLAIASADTPEPRSIVRAFTTPSKNHVALTMQNWIDLESIRSPLLRLALPEHLDELELAANVFRMSIRTLPVDAAILIANAMRRAVAEALSMALPMQRDGDSGSTAEDGFGAWLPLLAFLVAECGIDLTAARDLRVDQAFALLAARRRNQGWRCAGATYGQRDAVATKEEG